MLVLSRKDGEQLLFSGGCKARMVTVRITEDTVKLYRGRFLLGFLEYVQDSTVINVGGVDIGVMLIKYRACDDATLGFDAPREVRIVRDECL